MPSFFVPTPGDVTAQESPPPGICHRRKKKTQMPPGGGGLVQLELTDALSFQFQTNKKEIEICEFEMHLKFAL